MDKYCKHRDCQEHTAAELYYMAETLRRPKLFHQAMETFYSEVRCRKVPRKGPVNAPLPKARR